MEAKKDNRGGARPGAGRKPSPVKRTAVTIYLTPEQRDALAGLRSRGIDTNDALGNFIVTLAGLE